MFKSNFKIAWRNLIKDSLFVDFRMLAMLDLKMKEGRTFSWQMAADNLSMVLNEAAVTGMGMKDPLGKKVRV